jgi:hypothetical protein
LTGCGESSSLPASILEKSKMLLMSSSRRSALVRTVDTHSSSIGPRFRSRRRLVIPMIAFIGVRISWLMLARNSLLARLAASAASFADRSVSSAAALSRTCSRTMLERSSRSLETSPSGEVPFARIVRTEARRLSSTSTSRSYWRLSLRLASSSSPELSSMERSTSLRSVSNCP